MVGLLERSLLGASLRGVFETLFFFCKNIFNYKMLSLRSTQGFDVFLQAIIKGFATSDTRRY